MKEKEKPSGSQLLPVLLVCMLLACAGLVFAVYTHKELCWLKTQVREQEKLIQTLQLGNNARDIQVRGFLSFPVCCCDLVEWVWYYHGLKNCFNVIFVYVSGVRGGSFPEKRSNVLYLRRLVAQIYFLCSNNSYKVVLLQVRVIKVYKRAFASSWLESLLALILITTIA